MYSSQEKDWTKDPSSDAEKGMDLQREGQHVLIYKRILQGDASSWVNV